MTQDEFVAYLDEIERELLQLKGEDPEMRLKLLNLAWKIIKKLKPKGWITVMTKQQFAFYLEECAEEIRGYRLSKEYLDDICPSIMQAVQKFYNTEYEACGQDYKYYDQLQPGDFN